MFFYLIPVIKYVFIDNTLINNELLANINKYLEIFRKAYSRVLVEYKLT